MPITKNQGAHSAKLTESGQVFLIGGHLVEIYNSLNRKKIGKIMKLKNKINLYKIAVNFQ